MVKQNIKWDEIKIIIKIYLTELKKVTGLWLTDVNYTIEYFFLTSNNMEFSSQ